MTDADLCILEEQSHQRAQLRRALCKISEPAVSGPEGSPAESVPVAEEPTSICIWCLMERAAIGASVARRIGFSALKPCSRHA